MMINDETFHTLFPKLNLLLRREPVHSNVPGMSFRLDRNHASKHGADPRKFERAEPNSTQRFDWHRRIASSVDPDRKDPEFPAVS